MQKYTYLKRFLILFIMAFGLFIALPNFLPQSLLSKLPDFYTKKLLALGVDLQGGSRLVIELPKNAHDKLDETKNIIESRLNQLFTAQTRYRVVFEEERQIRIEVPKYFDIQTLKNISTVAGYFGVYLEDTSKNAKDIINGKMKIPNDLKFGFGLEDPPTVYLMEKQFILSNSDIETVFLTQQNSQNVKLSVKFKQQALERLKNIVSKLPASFIITLDDDVLAVISSLDFIKTGSLEIGIFARDVAENIKIVLSNPTLPSAITILEERTIGKDLGNHQAQSSLYAAFAALVFVAVFMISIYGMFGVVTTISLIVNLCLLIALLTLMGSLLTLSGFAGLILVMSISVDAHILIFERIRELENKNISREKTIKDGFFSAFSTIFDANITIFLAAIALLFLGSGAIYSFAYLVALGMVTSFFTCYAFTPLFLFSKNKIWQQKFFQGSFLFKTIQNAHISFIRLAQFTLPLAFFLSLATFSLFFTIGMQYGIDFKGGSVAILEKKQGDANLYDIADRIIGLNIDGVIISKSTNPSEALLTIASQNLGENAEQTVALKLQNEFYEDYKLERMDVVGPTLSNTLSKASVYAIVFSFLAIFFYIYWRFSIIFAIGAILTTLHDIIIIFGVFLVFQWQFNLWSVAAILAIIGYSLNDTIVVYDRIRQIDKEGMVFNFNEIVDSATNKTLSRTVLTSFATFIAHIPLYYLAGLDIKNFVSILLVGIIIGTYSSIFISGPLLVLFKKRSKKTATYRAKK